MIPEEIPDITEYIALDIGRPDIINDSTREYWKEFNEYVNTCEYPIIPNNMFFTIEQQLKSNPNWSYLGGGYKYMFWFQNQEDIDKFKTRFSIRWFSNDPVD